jgi:hypothetical protein
MVSARWGDNWLIQLMPHGIPCELPIRLPISTYAGGCYARDMCGRYAPYGPILRFALSILLLITVVETARAGNIVYLPSDVSVSLDATPSTGLETGDSVTFTISVTNNGPEVVDRLTLSSSFFVDELDLFAGSIGACEGPLGAAVSDFIGGYEYWLSWDPVWYLDPALLTLDVGETRTCEFSMPLTSAAPDAYQFSFGLAGFLSDLDSSNDVAEVVLRRAPSAASAAPVPTLSPFSLGLLTGMLIFVGGTRRRFAH